MFEYAKGYEIDGSDTSYSLITPDKEKCIEILKYYLSQKTIHRKRGVTVIRVNGKKENELCGKQFSYEQYETLWEILRLNEVDTIELKYSYVPSGQLYPEINRDIIDHVFKWAGKKPPVRKNPVLAEAYWCVDYIDVFFDWSAAKKWKECTDNLSSDRYISTIVKGKYFTIEFNCALGICFPMAAYGIANMAKAFPELDIEAEDSIKDAYYDQYGNMEQMDCYIRECIELDSNDIGTALGRILGEEAVLLDGGIISLFHVPKGIEKYDPLLAYKTYSGREHAAETSYYVKDPDPEFEMLKGIWKKKEVTAEEYATGLERLAAVTYFNDSAFSRYSMFRFAISLPASKEKIHCSIHARKEKNTIKLYMLVPYAVRDEVKRLLNI